MHVYYQLLQQGGHAPGSDFLVSALVSRIRKDVALHAEPENVNVYNAIMKLMSRYVVIQSPRIDRGLKILGIESELRVPTGIYTSDGREIVLFGFADLIYRTLRGDLVVRDHKTGTDSRRWNKDTVEANFQLLTYGGMIWRLRGEAPKVEVNFCSTYEYKKGPSDNQFLLYSHSHSEKVYENFFAETLQLVDDMLHSKPTPHYDDTCARCQFREPCFLERKGVSVTRVIETNYEVVDRSGPIRPVPFTQNNTNEG
jgi:hypothetical protein